MINPKESKKSNRFKQSLSFGKFKGIRLEVMIERSLKFLRNLNDQNVLFEDKRLSSTKAKLELMDFNDRNALI